MGCRASSFAEVAPMLGEAWGSRRPFLGQWAEDARCQLPAAVEGVVTFHRTAGKSTPDCSAHAWQDAVRQTSTLWTCGADNILRHHPLSGVTIVQVQQGGGTRCAA